MKKSMMFLAVSVFMLAGIASAQCPMAVACPQAQAPCVTPCAAPCTAVALSPGFYMTTRPATPVMLAVPVAAPCAAVPCAAAPAEAPAPCAVAPAEAPAPCAAAPAEAPAPCEAPAPAEAPAPCEAAPAAEAPAEAVAPCAAAPCTAAPCTAVTCRPAKLKRKMVCTRTVNVAGGGLGGRPYTVTKRVSCRPRSIYYWD